MRCIFPSFKKRAPKQNIEKLKKGLSQKSFFNGFLDNPRFLFKKIIDHLFILLRQTVKLYFVSFIKRIVNQGQQMVTL